MSEEKYYDEGDLSKEETGVESHFFSRGINNKDLNSDKKNPDSAAGGAGKDDENTISMSIRAGMSEPRRRKRRLEIAERRRMRGLI